MNFLHIRENSNVVTLTLQNPWKASSRLLAACLWAASINLEDGLLPSLANFIKTSWERLTDLQDEKHEKLTFPVYLMKPHMLLYNEDDFGVIMVTVITGSPLGF